jgi:hypothetical protein
VSRGEAYARIQAACDARDEGRDIFILARTDALIHGWDEAMTRAAEFKRIGADAVFVEALPDKEAMQRCVRELDIPMLANIIEGGMTENLSARELAGLGFAAVAYPWTLVAARLKSIRDTLEGLKKSIVEDAPPPMILGYSDVCEGVGFTKYWVSSHCRLSWQYADLIYRRWRNGMNIMTMGLWAKGQRVLRSKASRQEDSLNINLIYNLLSEQFIVNDNGRDIALSRGRYLRHVYSHSG